MAPRIAFAGFNLESVSTVPQRVELAEFQRVRTRGAEIPTRFRGSNTCEEGKGALFPQLRRGVRRGGIDRHPGRPRPDIPVRTRSLP